MTEQNSTSGCPAAYLPFQRLSSVGSARASRVVDKRGYMGGLFWRQHPHERKMTFLSKRRTANVHNLSKTPLVPSFFIENHCRKFREAEGVWIAPERYCAPALRFPEAKRRAIAAFQRDRRRNPSALFQKHLCTPPVECRS